MTGDEFGARAKERNTKYSIMRLSGFKQIRIEKYITRHWLAVIANRYQTFTIHREGTHHKKFVQSCRMSFILRYVRVMQATTQLYK